MPVASSGMTAPLVGTRLTCAGVQGLAQPRTVTRFEALYVSLNLSQAEQPPKVGIDIERCNLKASVEGLSARRSRAEVIVSIQEGEFIRRDFIDGGIPSI